MEIKGRVNQITVKDGKDHDIRFELHLGDGAALPLAPHGPDHHDQPGA